MQRIGVKTFEREADDLYFAENENVVFPTDSGKIELYSKYFEDAGFDPLPKYVAHEEPPEGFYRLIYGRAPMHTFGRTSNNPNLTDLMHENSVWINPKVSKEWGLVNGQYIWLKNQDGIVSDFKIKVRSNRTYPMGFSLYGTWFWSWSEAAETLLWKRSQRYTADNKSAG